MTPDQIGVLNVFGFVLNTFALLGIAWRGGRVLGRIDGTLERFAGDLEMVKDHPVILARITEQLDNIERRVDILERHPRR